MTYRDLVNYLTTYPELLDMPVVVYGIEEDIILKPNKMHIVGDMSAIFDRLPEGRLVLVSK